nr:hypothetical protein [Tessaracoccus flavescens]
MTSPVASTSVVTSGADTTAGSIPIFLAISGIAPPMVAAQAQTRIRLQAKTEAIDQPTNREPTIRPEHGERQAEQEPDPQLPPQDPRQV